eukprot:2347035-Rhodomonas_salina.1
MKVPKVFAGKKLEIAREGPASDENQSCASVCAVLAPKLSRITRPPPQGSRSGYWTPRRSSPETTATQSEMWTAMPPFASPAVTSHLDLVGSA